VQAGSRPPSWTGAFPRSSATSATASCCPTPPGRPSSPPPTRPRPADGSSPRRCCAPPPNKPTATSRQTAATAQQNVPPDPSDERFGERENYDQLPPPDDRDGYGEPLVFAVDEAPFDPDYDPPPPDDELAFPVR
jgi:hypothetical protein